MVLLLVGSAIGCAFKSAKMTALHPLSPQQAIAQEAIIGLHHPDPAEAMSNSVLPSIARILSPKRLSIGSCAGPIIKAPEVILATQKELKHRLGGIFQHDLSPYFTAHSSLISAEDMARYNAPGLQLSADQPAIAYTHFQCSWQSWSLYGLGEPGRFQTVFIGREISAGEALDSTGMVSKAMLPTLLQALREACPKLDLAAMRDRSAEFEVNGLLGCWELDGLRVKVGVRRLEDAEVVSLGGRYFLGVRVEWGAGN